MAQNFDMENIDEFDEFVSIFPIKISILLLLMICWLPLKVAVYEAP